MKPHLPVGRIAEALAPHALLVVCLAMLDEHYPTAAARHREKAAVKVAVAGADLTKAQLHQLHRVIAVMIHDLNRHCAPPFTYLGYSPLDGALGVWIDFGLLHEAEHAGKLVQISGDNWRGVKAPYVLSLRPEGMTLFHRKPRREVWTVT